MPPKKLTKTQGFPMTNVWPCVTPSKHICHARVMWLYLKVVTGDVEIFKMRKKIVYGPYSIVFH